ncbi:ABC transporter ATP-binding protein [Candidatus Omnitrophota bacterium]
MFKMTQEIKSIYSSITPSIKDVKTIVRYSLELLKKYRKNLALAFFFQVIGFPVGLSIIYITKTTLDKGILGGNLDVFVKFTVLGLLAFSLTRFFSYRNSCIVEKTKASFSKDVNYDLTRRLFGLDYLKVKKLSSAENSYILDTSYWAIQNLIFGQLPLFFSAIKLPVFLVLASRISMPLTMLVFVSLPFIAVHTMWASRKRKRYRVRELYYTGRHYSSINDSLLNIKLLKSFFKEDWALKKVSNLFSRKTDGELKTALFFHKSRVVGDIIVKLNTVIFWLVGGYLIIKGGLSFGSFSAVSMYALLVVSEMHKLGGIFQGLNSERLAVKRSASFIREIFTEREVHSLERAVSPLEANSVIEFREVAFGYVPEKLLFEEVSFRVSPGSWTLIRGISGEGKTTLLSLFLRLFPPQNGSISIGDKDISTIDKNTFFGNIAAVHQEPYLFNDTIIKNILLGEDGGTDSVNKAVFCAKVDELAKGLSVGYNTQVGEGGCALSGGQKQRVAIARALARDPKILILDEATSFLDSTSEKEVFRNIKEHYPDLTVIFVTHRTTAQDVADEVFTLDRGSLFKEDSVHIN